MKYILIFIAALTSSLYVHADSTVEKVDLISSLIFKHTDSAQVLAEDLLEESINQNHEYGIVQSNFILAYIYDKVKGDYGKAIIYYLEAIRYAKEFNYEQVKKDLVSLHKNCGVIFRKFKSYRLAEEYYNEAFMYADALQNVKEKNSIKFNTAGLLMDQERYDEAINELNNLIGNVETNSKNYWKYNNRLGIALFESGKYDLAIDAHNNSLEFNSLSDELQAYTIHNIGRCFSALNDFKNAKEYFNKALSIKLQLKDKTTLFSTYNELGNLDFKNGKIGSSLGHYDNAEKYMDEVTDINYYKLFKSKANALFQLKRFNEAKKYEDLYAKQLNNYVDKQEEIQQIDKQYNIDLITKRYFDNVAKQEQIASILLYSKVISGSLLALLLLTIGYNWYQKVQLRKSIIQDLIKLKVVE